MILTEGNKVKDELVLDDWIDLNRNIIFKDSKQMEKVAPFPPADLMSNVSGLIDNKDFASHGCDIYLALNNASDIPLTDFTKVLDFGCGCGRLARMFKAHDNELYGCDLDPRHIKWIQDNLDYMNAMVSDVHPPLPYNDNFFDAIISVSIFTHLNESSQDEFLRDLHRIAKQNSRLLITVHGAMAIEKAINNSQTRDLLCMDEDAFQQAVVSFNDDKHGFVLQQGHLTTSNADGNDIVNSPFEYGISFISENYIKSHWGKWFEIVDYSHGAIHEFQDIVVLEPREMR